MLIRVTDNVASARGQRLRSYEEEESHFIYEEGEGREGEGSNGLLVCITQSNPIAANLTPVLRKIGVLIELCFCVLRDWWEWPLWTGREADRAKITGNNEGDQEG